MVLGGVVADRMQQVSLSEAHTAVNKERVVGTRRSLRHGQGGGVGKPVARPHHKGLKREPALKACRQPAALRARGDRRVRCGLRNNRLGLWHLRRCGASRRCDYLNRNGDVISQNLKERILNQRHIPLNDPAPGELGLHANAEPAIVNPECTRTLKGQLVGGAVEGPAKALEHLLPHLGEPFGRGVLENGDGRTHGLEERGHDGGTALGEHAPPIGKSCDQAAVLQQHKLATADAERQVEFAGHRFGVRWCHLQQQGEQAALDIRRLSRWQKVVGRRRAVYGDGHNAAPAEVVLNLKCPALGGDQACGQSEPGAGAAHDPTDGLVGGGIAGLRRSTWVADSGSAIGHAHGAARIEDRDQCVGEPGVDEVLDDLPQRKGGHG